MEMTGVDFGPVVAGRAEGLPVPGAMELLDSRLAGLESTIEMAAHRLAPVLRPEMASQVAKLEEEPLTELLRSVQRVERLTERLRELVDRVDL